MPQFVLPIFSPECKQINNLVQTCVLYMIWYQINFPQVRRSGVLHLGENDIRTIKVQQEISGCLGLKNTIVLLTPIGGGTVKYRFTGGFVPL